MESSITIEQGKELLLSIKLLDGNKKSFRELLRQYNTDIYKLLGDELSSRGLTGAQVGVVINEMYKIWLGKTSREYEGANSKKVRDGISDYELAICTLAEITAIDLLKNNDTKNIEDIKEIAQKAANIANAALDKWREEEMF
ncbi:MAG: hypothetical protein FWE23_08920 [Chitinivibrionia bacterium]|nr:hypothetical protein [Chitinivibrionia bacterium]